MPSEYGGAQKHGSMCGIRGFRSVRSRPSPDFLRKTAEAMALAIRHRGPDAEGTWIDPEAGLAFGHCRLSIVDLSAAGAQPMLSPSGRSVISYNGEIFNFPALRQILEQHGQSFTGHSDTDVPLAGLHSWRLGEPLRPDGTRDG